MGPDDQVILVQHCPDWLVDWFWGHTKAKNLRQLVRGPLAGRARVQLAGERRWHWHWDSGRAGRVDGGSAGGGRGLVLVGCEASTAPLQRAAHCSMHLTPAALPFPCTWFLFCR